jgi:hypothetical protein
MFAAGRRALAGAGDRAGRSHPFTGAALRVMMIYNGSRANWGEIKDSRTDCLISIYLRITRSRISRTSCLHRRYGPSED